MNHHNPASHSSTNAPSPMKKTSSGDSHTTAEPDTDSLTPSIRGATGNSSSRLIHVMCRGKLEKLQISDHDTNEDIKDLVRGAVHAGPHDIVKLFTSTSSMLPMTSKLPPNTPESAYRAEVVVSGLPSTVSSNQRTQAPAPKRKVFLPSAFNSQSTVTSGPSNDRQPHEIETLVQRLTRLESQVYPAGGMISDSSPSNNSCVALIEDLLHKMEDTQTRLQRLEQLNWMGFESTLKPMNPGKSYPSVRPNVHTIRKSEDECLQVWKQFCDLCQKSELNETIRLCLRQTDFNNWNWEDAELILLLRQMYIDLEFHLSFNIELSVLEKWLFRVYRHYNHVPFHNFKHAFMVAQMMYAMIWKTRLWTRIDSIELLSLLTGAVCHDLDHPGYNNVYQINARTQLAVRYNDISPLENHHSAMTFDILNQRDCCILKNLCSETQKKARESIIRCILATDMARHNEILKDFREILPTFDYKNKEHKDLLMMVLIKVSDISNEARPIQVSEPWLNCLLEEFFRQSDTEKLEGLPVTPFMDRDKVTKSSSQCGFIKFVILPLFESLGQLLPELEESLIQPVRHQLEYYTELQKKDLAAAASSIGSAPSATNSIADDSIVESEVAAKNGLTADPSSRKSSLSVGPSVSPSPSNATKT